MISGILLRSRSLTCELEAVELRQIDVEDREVRLLALERVERREAVVRLDDEEACLLQRETRHRQQIGIVVDEEESSLRRLLRQVHGRVRALVVRALERHRTAVPLDDGSYNEEAETEPAFLRIFTARAVELLEQTGVVGVFGPGPSSSTHKSSPPPRPRARRS